MRLPVDNSSIGVGDQLLGTLRATPCRIRRLMDDLLYGSLSDDRDTLYIAIGRYPNVP